MITILNISIETITTETSAEYRPQQRVLNVSITSAVTALLQPLLHHSADERWPRMKVDDVARCQRVQETALELPNENYRHYDLTTSLYALHTSLQWRHLVQRDHHFSDHECRVSTGVHGVFRKRCFDDQW